MIAKLRMLCSVMASLRRSSRRLLVARQHVLGALPRRQEVEVPEFLGQLHRLVDHAGLVLVVADLDEAGEREVLAQRVPLEAVIGEEPAQVRMAREQDAVEVVGLALEPVRRREHLDHGGHRRLRRRSAPSRGCGVMAQREQVVDHVEALLAGRIVGAADVDEAAEGAGRVVAQVGQRVDDVAGLHHEGQLAERDGARDDRGPERAGDVVAERCRAPRRIPARCGRGC